MVRLADCLACQAGDHDNHYEVIQAVPEGMMGGVRCSCRGECRKDAAERKARFLRRMGGERLARFFERNLDG